MRKSGLQGEAGGVSWRVVDRRVFALLAPDSEYLLSDEEFRQNTIGPLGVSPIDCQSLCVSNPEIFPAGLNEGALPPLHSQLARENCNLESIKHLVQLGASVNHPTPFLKWILKQ